MIPAIPRSCRLLALFACAVFLSGCHKSLSTPTGEYTSADRRWELFEALPEPAPAPFRLEGSLRFGPVNDTNRVNYILWSNGDVPLRMDVMAGGMLGASVEVTDNTVLAYLPRNEKAYIGTDNPSQALMALGLPLPVSVAQLNAFLQGRYQEGLGHPRQHDFRPAIEGDGIVYAVSSDNGEYGLELAPDGLPTGWTMPQGWRIAIDHDPATKLPTRLDGTLPGGTPHTFRSGAGEDFRFVLIVRTRQATQSFAHGDLTLSVPQGTPVFDLDTQALNP